MQPMQPMQPTQPTKPTRSSEAMLAELGTRLAEAVAAAIPAWVGRTLRARAPDVGDDVVAGVTGEVEAEVLGDLRALLASDVDDQRQSPLAVVRRAAATVGGALDGLGVPRPARDDQQRALFPHDLHDVGPASFADLSEEAGQAGIAWGAAKAFVHRERHRG